MSPRFIVEPSALIPYVTYHFSRQKIENIFKDYN